jgi:hypothetical protein
MFRRRSLVALALVLIAIPAAVIMSVVFTADAHGSDVRVPNLVGMTGVSADVKLQQIGLKTYSGGSALMWANEFGNITRTHRAILRACMDATRANRRGRHAVGSFSGQRV